MDFTLFFPIEALKDIDAFLKELDLRGEAILVKDNKPMYKIVKIGLQADVDPPTNLRPMDLWCAMKIVLSSLPEKKAHAKEIARLVNEKGLYYTRRGGPVSAVHIRSRAEHRPNMFKCEKGNIIKLI